MKCAAEELKPVAEKVDKCAEECQCKSCSPELYKEEAEKQTNIKVLDEAVDISEKLAETIENSCINFDELSGTLSGTTGLATDAEKLKKPKNTSIGYKALEEETTGNHSVTIGTKKPEKLKGFTDTPRIYEEKKPRKKRNRKKNEDL